MTVQNAAGTAVTKAGLSKTAYVQDDQLWTVNTTVYEVTLIPGSTTKTRRRKLWNAGDIVRQSDLDRAWPTATVASISPAVGPAAGGTAVTISGTNLRGVTGVTFGGTAATSVVAVNETTVTAVTPAKTADTYDVVVTDDAGAVTKVDFFTYE